MNKRWFFVLVLVVSVAFFGWSCGRSKAPVEDDFGSGSGSSSSASNPEHYDPAGEAAPETKYDSSDPRLSGHSQAWPEADTRALIEIEKQKVEAEKAYNAYMASKEAGNPDQGQLNTGIQLFEQLQAKLNDLLDKYPDDKALSELGTDIGNKLHALSADLGLK